MAGTAVSFKQILKDLAGGPIDKERPQKAATWKPSVGITHYEHCFIA
jgi:hypothetical protein